MRDAVGVRELTLEVGDGSVEGLWQRLVATAPDAAGVRTGLRVAINRAYAPWDSVVVSSDEVAFIAPVAGG